MSDHPQLPVELQEEVTDLVKQTQQRSGWPARQTLQALEIAPGSYYRWRRRRGDGPPRPRSPAGSMYELLPAERQAAVVVFVDVHHGKFRDSTTKKKSRQNGLAFRGSGDDLVLVEDNLVVL